MCGCLFRWLILLIQVFYLLNSASDCWCPLGDVQLSIVGVLETFLYYYVAIYDLQLIALDIQGLTLEMDSRIISFINNPCSAPWLY